MNQGLTREQVRKAGRYADRSHLNDWDWEFFDGHFWLTWRNADRDEIRARCDPSDDPLAPQPPADGWSHGAHCDCEFCDMEALRNAVRKSTAPVRMAENGIVTAESKHFR